MEDKGQREKVTINSQRSDNFRASSQKLYGLYVKGFVDSTCVSWLVDTGAARSILSRDIAEKLLNNSCFNSAGGEHSGDIFLADGKRIVTCGSSLVTVTLGEHFLQVNVLIADITDEAILGMDFLSQINAVVEIVQGTLSVNGEVINCIDCENQPLSCRCVVRRMTVVTPNSEVVVRSTLRQRKQVNWRKTSTSNLRVIESSNNSNLLNKGLCVARTLVDTELSDTVPIRVLNLTDEPQTIPANTSVAIATAVRNVQDSNLPDLDNNDNVSNGTDTDTDIQDNLPESLNDLLSRSRTSLNSEEERQVTELLIKYQHAFSLSDQDIGRTDILQHRINTGNASPVRQTPRRTPPWKQEEIERQVDTLLKSDMIEESSSPWAVNVVLVTKKDGSQRLCVDYRRLDDVTVKDAFPLPNISDSLDCLVGSKRFSTLDMASGYWQVAMDPETKEKSAFVTTSGLYHWNVMPFGLTSATGKFERLMTLLLKGLQFKICLCYLDDIIVFANSFTEHLTRLEEVFKRVVSANLKLKPAKCELFKKETAYLGHIVSEDGIKTDPKKVERVSSWPIPESPTEVKSFLGLASYYRRFVPGFASIAKPLYKLTEWNLPEFEGNEECQDAFTKLKQLLTTSPVLAYPQSDAPFILDTDASNHGIGAVLSQIQDGVEKPIVYCSRTLSKSERNYCTTRKELLAIVEFTK